MSILRDLEQVFQEARRLVALKGNDFSWSGWEDATEALREIDVILATIRRGERPGAYMNVLFLPTGPLQELSLSSGWGDAFVALAGRFDAAVADVETKPPSESS